MNLFLNKLTVRHNIGKVKKSSPNTSSINELTSKCSGRKYLFYSKLCFLDVRYQHSVLISYVLIFPYGASQRTLIVHLVM